MLCQPMALAAQFLEFFRAEGVAQQFIGIAPGVETGAVMGLQRKRAHAAAPQHFRERLHRRAVERHVAQHERMGAGIACLLHQACDGILGHVAIQRRRAQRAIGVGADQRGQGDPVGAPHRDRGQQADQARLAVGCLAPAESDPTPVRPRAEAFAANSQSGR